MFPNNPQGHSDNPANLPLVSPVEQPAAHGASPAQTSSDMAVPARFAMQTKHLVKQYSNDPYKLSEALDQLKSAYLAEQFHITSNQAEN